jgi:hypothetical protein
MQRKGITVSSARLQALRGRHVGVALTNGKRFDDCRLLSAGHSPTNTLWLVSDGADLFVRRDELMAVWEVTEPRAA